MEYLALPFILAFLATPLVIRFARRFGLVDDPKHRYHPAHTHTGIIPRAGGLALFFGVVLSLLIFLPVTKQMWGMILSMTLLTAVGLFDDKKDINPYVRLCTNALAALIIIGVGVGIPYITNPFEGGVVQLDTWRIRF